MWRRLPATDLGVSSLMSQIFGLLVGKGKESNQRILDICKASSVVTGRVSEPHFLRAGRNLLVESCHAQLKSWMTWLSYFRFFMISCLWFLGENKSRRILKLWKEKSPSMSLGNGYRSLSSRSSRFDSLSPRQSAHRRSQGSFPR